MSKAKDLKLIRKLNRGENVEIVVIKDKIESDIVQKLEIKESQTDSHNLSTEENEVDSVDKLNLELEENSTSDKPGKSTNDEQNEGSHNIEIKTKKRSKRKRRTKNKKETENRKERRI